MAEGRLDYSDEPSDQRVGTSGNYELRSAISTTEIDTDGVVLGISSAGSETKNMNSSATGEVVTPARARPQPSLESLDHQLPTKERLKKIKRTSSTSPASERRRPASSPYDFTRTSAHDTISPTDSFQSYGSRRSRPTRRKRRGGYPASSSLSRTSRSSHDDEASYSDDEDDGSQKRTMRLRTFLVLVFAAQIAFWVLFTWGLTFATSSSAVRSIADSSENILQQDLSRLQTEIQHKLAQSAEYIVNQAPLAAEMTQRVVNGGSISLHTPAGREDRENWIQVANYFLAQVKAFDVGYAYAGCEGLYFAARRANQKDGPPQLQYGAVTDPDGTPLDGWYSWNVDWETGAIDWNSKYLSWKGYEPHKRPWYIAGAEKAMVGDISLAWTAPYLWQGSPPFNLVYGLSGTIPVISGGLVCVVGGDFILSAISRSLEEQDLGGSENGILYLVERAGVNAGNLIATSKGEPFRFSSPDPTCTRDSHDDNPCGSYDRLGAADSPEHATKMSADYFLDQYGKWDGVPDGVQAAVSHATGVMHVSAQFVQTAGLDWLLVSVIPDEEIMGAQREVVTDTQKKLRETSVTAALILIGSLVVSVAIAMLSANKVSQPMRRLQKGMTEMRSLEFVNDIGEDETSRLTEIAAIQNTYNRLQMALKNFHVFLPPVVVNRIVRGDSDAAVLGIQSAQCTLIVGELSNWHSITQEHPLPVVLSLLEEQLTNATDAIGAYGGVVSDFSAERISSHWVGDFRQNSTRACKAALTQLTGIREIHLNRQGNRVAADSTKLRRPELSLVIHADHAALGNTGSPNLMKYGVVGHARTFADDLLTQARSYRRPIIVSSTVYEFVKDEFYCYRVDETAIGTGPEVEPLYELVGVLDDIPKAQLAFFKRFEEAIAAYDAGTFTAALEVIEAILAVDKDFEPAKQLRSKCHQRTLSAGVSAEIQVLKGKDLAIVKTIGFGGYSEVFLARWQGVDIAVKKMKISLRDGQVDDARQLAAWRHELLLWSKLRHPNIVFLIGEIRGEDWIGIATEYLARGSLQHLYRQLKGQGRRVSSRLRLSIVRDIAAGMHYLHTREPKIIHRDLKSSNVLLDDQFRAKVADFGISKEVTNSASFTATGTPHWMAPEVMKAGILSDEYDEQSDVYSFAMLVWELVTSSTPWQGEDVMSLLTKFVKDPDRRPRIPVELDGRWRRLIESCWATNPKKRLTFAQILDYLDVEFGADGSPSQPNTRKFGPPEANMQSSPIPVTHASANSTKKGRDNVTDGKGKGPNSPLPTSTSRAPRSPKPPLAPDSSRSRTQSLSGSLTGKVEALLARQGQGQEDEEENRRRRLDELDGSESDTDGSVSPEIRKLEHMLKESLANSKPRQALHPSLDPSRR